MRRFKTMMKPPVFLFTPALAFLVGCGGKSTLPPVASGDTLHNVSAPPVKLLPPDTLITVGRTAVWILSPKDTPKADILVLPGWNFPKEKICNESDFCSQALARGYRLVLPEMMKSVYASQYYPETRKDYRSFLTLPWVTDTLLPELKKNYGIFTGRNNYLHGISTGARGAALVHLATGTQFTKVVLLSGDYHNTALTDDNLLRNIFGPYAQFPDRWKNNDNPWEQAASWSAALYIGHGRMDETVDAENSISFSAYLDSLHAFPPGALVTHFPDSAGHNFSFWGEETNAVLDFLDTDFSKR